MSTADAEQRRAPIPSRIVDDVVTQALQRVIAFCLALVAAAAVWPGVSRAEASAAPFIDPDPGGTAAVPSIGAERGVAADRFAWPLRPAPDVVTPFAPPPHRYGPGHRGVDLAAAPGQAVLAAADGVVVFAGMVAGRPVVSVQHPSGLRSTYEPVDPSVRRGDPVRAGEPIGTAQEGHRGCPGSVCLHWGVRRGSEYLDPLALVQRPRIRLKPAPR